MFVHVYSSIIHVTTEEVASCVKRLGKRRNVGRSGHSSTKQTPVKAQGHGGKIVSSISEAHEKMNPRSL